MRRRAWLSAAAASLFIGGCAGMQPRPAAMQPGPSLEAKAALAPTGKLRVAFLSGPIYATKDSATGELKGVAVDLGQEIARRIGVPFEPVVHAALPAVISGAKTGEWDVALLGINAERATVMDFSPPYMEVEQGYLVRAGVPVATAAYVDKPGIRIGVLEKAGADAALTATVKTATLVRTKSVPELFALLQSEKADVIAATKAALFAGAGGLPGSRVLDGRIFAEPIGMAVPKGRDAAAAAYVGRFVEDAKAQGLVGSVIERAGLRGVVAAASK